ncbi:MAG: TonB-dependent receptor [Steroidobacteraceae bacterium]
MYLVRRNQSGSSAALVSTAVGDHFMSISSSKVQPAVAAAVAAILAASAPAFSADSAPEDQLDEVVITGSRQAGLTVAESPAPIQLVSADALEASGKPDLMSALATVIPSFSAQAFGGDMANQTLQAKLRGLSPNHVLVLVDGKRRHTTANLAVLSGPYQGGAGVDLNFIPASSIDHVEVLTDGAAAQYGSDAIAGVINIITKKNSSGGNVGANYGAYMDGGGQTAGVDGNAGFGLGADGYLNVSGDVRNHGHSYRGDIDPRIYGTSGINDNIVYADDYPYVNLIQGDAEYHQKIATFSAGLPLGAAWNFYSLGSYGAKQAASFENYRTPNKAYYTDSTTGETTYQYPYGFNPREATREIDYQLTAGVKGEIAAWNVDLSSSYGEDRVAMYTLDSTNLNLYNETGSSPVDFYDGTLTTGQMATTLDFNKDFDVGLAGPLNVAFGGETRHDTYSITAGDAASYYCGTVSTLACGASSFPGFSALNAGSYGRTNYAGYVDLAVNPISGLRIDAAARYEHFTDFGNTTVGKLTGRYDFSEVFALRGTVSTGFRAPTLAEEYYSASNVGPTSFSLQLGPNSAAAQALGLGTLKPEKSTNFSFGVVLRPTAATTLTLDVYRIDIKDRIVGTDLCGTENIGGAASVCSQAVVDALTSAGVGSDIITKSVSIFTNGADTKTQGADLVFSLPVDYAIGHIDWSVGATYNSTEVTKIRALPALLDGAIDGGILLNQTAISDLETASPKYVVNLGANWTLGALSVNLKEAIYGKSSEWGQGDDGEWYLTTIGVTPITNLDIGYKLSEALKINVGASNLFNTYPDEINGTQRQTYLDAGDNSYVQKYPSFSPFGINGGYYYAKASYSF